MRPQSNQGSEHVLLSVSLPRELWELCLCRTCRPCTRGSLLFSEVLSVVWDQDIGGPCRGSLSREPACFLSGPDCCFPLPCEPPMGKDLSLRRIKLENQLCLYRQVVNSAETEEMFFECSHTLWGSAEKLLPSLMSGRGSDKSSPFLLQPCSLPHNTHPRSCLTALLCR